MQGSQASKASPYRVSALKHALGIQQRQKQRAQRLHASGPMMNIVGSQQKVQFMNDEVEPESKS